MNISKLSLETLIANTILGNFIEEKSCDGKITYKPYCEQLFVDIVERGIKISYYIDHFKSFNEYANNNMKTQDNFKSFVICKGVEITRENCQILSDNTYIEINTIAVLQRVVNEM